MTGSGFRILLVEDDENVAAAVRTILEVHYIMCMAGTIADARVAMKADRPDLMLLDLNLPDGSGTDLLEEIRKEDQPLDVIVITARQDVGTAVQVMKLGVRDYLQKPFSQEDLLLCVQRAFDKWQLSTEVTRLRTELYAPYHWGSIVGESPAMKSAFDVARRMSQSLSNVLITGESGTGKDLIARAIHCDGLRSKGPFISVNCAQFTSTLLESELFGHEKGAFTGAVSNRRGRFELADHGTLFLNEIGNTTLEMQAGILRTVESHEFERVGGETTLKSDFRLIAATNTDLEEAFRKGKFREDLYYRLNVVRIEVPPLRARSEDIPALCVHFLRQLSEKTRRPLRPITPEAMAVLQAWHWPGNVRELQNILEMADALEDGDWITSRCMPMRMRAAASQAKTAPGTTGNLLDTMVEEYERTLLEEQLRINGWNQIRTAQSLGTHRNTINKKVKKYGISLETSRPR